MEILILIESNIDAIIMAETFSKNSKNYLEETEFYVKNIKTTICSEIEKHTEKNVIEILFQEVHFWTVNHTKQTGN